MNIQWTDDQLAAAYDSARKRLESLGIDSEMVIDESGQTSAEEHLTWLQDATDDDIIY